MNAYAINAQDPGFLAWNWAVGYALPHLRVERMRMAGHLGGLANSLEESQLKCVCLRQPSLQHLQVASPSWRLHLPLSWMNRRHRVGHAVNILTSNSRSWPWRWSMLLNGLSSERTHNGRLPWWASSFSATWKAWALTPALRPIGCASSGKSLNLPALPMSQV